MGYGRIGRGAKGQGNEYVHRVSWMIHKGRLPRGLFVLHKCDVPLCVNPDHLFVGTQADNMRDMSQKGRGRKIGLKGQDHGSAKLTEKQVIKVRRLYASGLRQVDVAKLFNIGQSHVSKLIRGESWKHLPL